MVLGRPIAAIVLLLLVFAGYSPAQTVANWQTILISGAGRPISNAAVSVCQGAATTAASLASNVVTLTMASNPITAGFQLQGTIIVYAFGGSDSYFNGTYTITSLSSTQIQYSLTHANGSATSNGAVVQQGATPSTACLPLATLYTDSTGTNTAANPTSSDGLGNVSIWALPGLYQIQYAGSNVTTTMIVTTIPGFASGSQTQVLNGALYVGGTLGPFWGGGDIGAQVMAAYATLPAVGGTIYILPQTNGACYTWTTQINFSTKGKYVKLAGVTPPSFQGTGSSGVGEQGACLNWTATSGTAMIIDWTNTNGAGNTPGGGIENLTLWNNQCATNGGCGSTANGLSIGPVNGGAMSASFRNVKWRGWGAGWLMPANAAQLNFTIYVENFSFQQNTIGVNTAQNSEGWRFTTGVFLQNGTGWTQAAGPGGVQVEFDDVHWDGNSTAAISGNCSGNWTFVGNHFENLGGTTTHYFSCGNTGVMMFQGGFAGDDNASSNTDYWFTANTVLGNLSIFSAGETATNVFVVTVNCMTIANGNTPVLTGVLSGKTCNLYGLQNMWQSATAPTLGAGWGTTPSILTNGSAEIFVGVGTGGVANSGTINFNTTAKNAWQCSVANLTAHASNRADDTVMTAATATSITVQNQTKSTGAAIAWTAGDQLVLTGCGAR